MHKKNTFITLSTLACFLVIAGSLWLATAQPVGAQCGSQASSCKDCHETQGQKSVNTDGTGWHQSHAFGDFCYICHGGNTQSTDKDAAHLGMVPPLQDVKASCQQCHPKDLDARAKVYADELGVAPGGSEVAQPPANPAAEQTCVPAITIAEPANNIPAEKAVVLVQPARTVDYVARYNENVLGIRKVNWGGIGLASLVVVVLVGGTGFVATRKGWVTVTFESPAKTEESSQDPEEKSEA
jgi:hypothetical protein